MRSRIHISPGDCFQIDTQSFGIAETLSGYTLYSSVNCPSIYEGKRVWEQLAKGQDAPEGWKACSDPIPANTQHLVYDNVYSVVYYLKGFTDKEGTYLRW